MKIAIVGASGLVGRTIIKILEEKNMVRGNNIILFASSNSAGKYIKVQNRRKKILELNEVNFNKYVNRKQDEQMFVFFSAGGSVSKKWASKFVEKGCVVVDNSSAFRREKHTPLIVPEVNFEEAFIQGNNNKNKTELREANIQKNKFCGIISNPNCSTIGISLPLFALSKLYKIKRIIVSTYQAVSGAGQKGIIDLKKRTHNKFLYSIFNNAIPQIDLAQDDGYTFEEDKMKFELRKILKSKSLKISATCVRVPVENCHSESVYVEFNKEPDLTLIRKTLNNFNGIKLVDDLKNNIYPMPILVDGEDEVFVGRIRKDSSNKNAISLFICFDNIRKGAALNAVQIVERLIAKLDKK